MKIHVLTYYDHWEDETEVIGYFSSKERAESYRDKYIKKSPIYEKKRFDIDWEEIDPDDSWMEEA